MQLQQAGATHLTLNPAGPCNLDWSVDLHCDARGRGFVRKAVLAELGYEPLAEPAARAPGRAEIAARLQAAAADAQNFNAAADAAFAAARSLVDRHSEVAVLELQARNMRDGLYDIKAEVNELIKLALALGEIGEAARAADALAEAGRRAITALDAGDPDPWNPWLRKSVAVIAANLPTLCRPEHDEAAAQALDATHRCPRS